MVEAAMFPLGTVLFPHMPLPLRVFEDRYLVMLAHVLDSDSREFGVVLIERGHEVGGGDGRFTIGTMARVEQLTRGDDDVRLLARGGTRVEVMSWLDEDPYPRAVVRPMPELVWDDALTPLRASTERTVRRVLARAAEFTDTVWDADVELSDDPLASCWQLAAIAPLGPLDQVRLLRAQSVDELLRGVCTATLEAEPTLTAIEVDGSFDDAVSRLLDEEGPDADPPKDA